MMNIDLDRFTTLHTEFTDDKDITGYIYTDDEFTDFYYWIRVGVAGLELKDPEALSNLIDILQAMHEETIALSIKGDING